mgnify:CR=1 FL=1
MPFYIDPCFCVREKTDVKKRVLIIEDNYMLSKVLQDLLESDGFEVSQCDNGTHALSVSESTCFDVIISDYRLPGLNGAQVTRSLRDRCRGSFIVGCSAEPREKDFLDAGADVFLKKPFRFSELISLIE